MKRWKVYSLICLGVAGGTAYLCWTPYSDAMTYSPYKLLLGALLFPGSILAAAILSTVLAFRDDRRRQATPIGEPTTEQDTSDFWERNAAALITLTAIVLFFVALFLFMPTGAD